MKKSRMSLILLSVSCLLSIIAVSGCGGKNTSSQVKSFSTVSTKQVIKTAFKYAGKSYSSAQSPFTAAGLARIGTKNIGRVLARDAYTLSGYTTGTITTYSYTGEKFEGCVMDGSVAYSKNYDSSGNATGTMTGVLSMSLCNTAPATYTVNISAGALTTTCSQGDSQGCSAGTTLISATLTLTSASISGTGLFSSSETFNQTSDIFSTTVISTRSDGSHTTGACTYAANANPVSCTENGVLGDGTTVNFTSNVYNTGQVTLGGSETTPEGVVITYSIASFQPDGSGVVSFSMNDGYTGSLTFYAGGSGAGTILDINLASVASMKWTAAGVITVRYTDNSTQVINI